VILWGRDDAAKKQKKQMKKMKTQVAIALALLGAFSVVLPVSAVITVPNDNFQQLVGQSGPTYTGPFMASGTAYKWTATSSGTPAGDYATGDWAGAGRNLLSDDNAPYGAGYPHYGEVLAAPFNTGTKKTPTFVDSTVTSSTFTLKGTSTGVYQVQFWAMDYNPNQSAKSKPSVSGTYAVTLDGQTEDVTIFNSYNHLDPDISPTSTPGNLAGGYGGNYVEYFADFTLGKATITGATVSFQWEGDNNGTAGGEGLLDEVKVVPEPSTWIGGAGLLIPFGMSALRKLRAKLLAA